MTDRSIESTLREVHRTLLDLEQRLGKVTHIQAAALIHLDDLIDEAKEAVWKAIDYASEEYI